MENHSADELFMREALVQAGQAADGGEVPVGAVVVHENNIVGRGYNLTRRLQDATLHAEMVALRRAAETLGTWRLEGCTLYVTVEPCVMCSGAMVLARLDRLVYGAPEPKFGACGSLYDLVRDPRLNHRLTVTPGVLAEECARLMQGFFQGLRSQDRDRLL